jgi:hypothetical protein
MKCVFLLSLRLLSETFIILRRIQREMHIGLQVTCLFLLSDFNENLNFRDIFSKCSQISNFIQICLVGAELFLVDRVTDRQADT